MRNSTNPPAIIYADAFFLAGDKKGRTIEEADEFGVPTSQWHNGWGCIIFPRRSDLPEAFFFSGTAPDYITRLFTPTAAYIYFLETLAQVIPLVVGQHWLSEYYLSFVDNEASKHALIKGFGGNGPVNNLVAACWHTAAILNKDPWFERVCSKGNPSDEISRFEFQAAIARGWIQLHWDFEPLYRELLARGADDFKPNNSLANCMNAQYEQFILGQHWP